MTEQNQAVISRLSAEFNSLSSQFARVSGDLTELHTVLAALEAPATEPDVPENDAAAEQPAAAEKPNQPQPQPRPEPQPGPRAATQYGPRTAPQGPASPWSHSAPDPRAYLSRPAMGGPQRAPYPSWMQPVAAGRPVGPGQPVGPYAPGARPLLPTPPGAGGRGPAGPPPPAKPSLWQRMTADPGGGLIGKILAVAGVAVTLIGVVMMLVLAAQAGILRPEIRVAAGAVLAAVLVVVAIRMADRPGGRVGAIALSATGIAAAYFDVVAVTRFYDWLPDYGGLILAGLVTFGGLLLARRWNSQHLGLLVLIPVFILAPVLTEGPSLLLVGFMLAMAIGSFPVQLGKDWVFLHAARVTASTATLLAWIFASAWTSESHVALATIAIVGNAVFGVAGSVVLVRKTALPHLTALLGCATVVPVVFSPVTLDRWVAAATIAGVAALLLAVVLLDRTLPAVPRRIYSATAAVTAVIAAGVAFEGPVLAPVLLAMSIVIAVAGRSDLVARIIAALIGMFGGIGFLAISPPGQLTVPTDIETSVAASIMVGSVLAVAAIWLNLWAWYRAATTPPSAQNVQGFGIIAALGSLYAVTALTVTAGVAIGGSEGGFLGGHMAATICWMGGAATLLIISISIAKGHKRFGGISRNVAVGAGLGLTAAAVAKLFLFDLATLDGIFRVAVFIVVGLILLAVGAGYARALGNSAAAEGSPDNTPVGAQP
ncbi:MAG: DUF2339 domain-containing protein [Gordonia sp.]|nr:DUF2339 domain-containing protein [Gordonia sp. (in: high G+C Gram-positive bacteria)]